MGDTVKGSPGETNVTIPPPLRPPNYGFSNWLGNQLGGMWGQALPSYGKPLDQGLSPTMQQAIHGFQQRAVNPAPAVLGQAQGTLGALMNPGQSGLRNPFSMSSQTGGGSTMTPEALQSSRDAMLRFQNPRYNLAVPRMGQGYGAPFGGAQPPRTGGPPAPAQGGFSTDQGLNRDLGLSGTTQARIGGGQPPTTGGPPPPGGNQLLGMQLNGPSSLAPAGGQGAQQYDQGIARLPLSQNPNFMLNPNYKARAPGDNSRELRSTDNQYIPANPGSGQSRFPQGGGQQQGNPKGGGGMTNIDPGYNHGVQGLANASQRAFQQQQQRGQTLTGRGAAPGQGQNALAQLFQQFQQSQAPQAATGGISGGNSKLWYSGTPEGKSFTPDFSANPYLPNGGYDAKAAIRRYGINASGGNAPGYQHPQPHGQEAIDYQTLAADVAAGRAPAAVMQILQKAGMQGPINQLGFRDLQEFGGGGGRTFMQDIDRIYAQQKWNSSQGQQDLAAMDPATRAAISQQYGLGGGTPTGSMTPSLGGNPKGDPNRPFQVS